MAMKCCVCEDILLEESEAEELRSSKSNRESSKVSSGYCPDCFGRLVGSAIGVQIEKSAA